MAFNHLAFDRSIEISTSRTDFASERRPTRLPPASASRFFVVQKKMFVQVIRVRSRDNQLVGENNRAKYPRLGVGIPEREARRESERRRRYTMTRISSRARSCGELLRSLHVGRVPIILPAAVSSFRQVRRNATRDALSVARASNFLPITAISSWPRGTRQQPSWQRELRCSHSFLSITR